MSRETPSYTSGPLSIDAIQPGDLPVFREMLGVLVDFLDMRDVYTLSDEALHQAIFGESGQMEAIIARYHGEAVGFASWVEGFHLVTGKHVLWFEYIYVKPRFRSLLITPALLIYLAVLAKRRGCIRMEGFVHEWNTQTAGFYKSLGAQEIAQTAYRLTLDDIDWSQFQRFLPAEPQARTD